MNNVKIIKLRNITDNKGNLVPIEANQDVPFEIKRVYCITDVQRDLTRGYHAHRKLEQVLICLNGSVKIKLDDGQYLETTLLCNTLTGLYVGSMVWHEMFEFSDGAVLLVLASDYYDESDYIRDYDEFLKLCQ